MSVITNNMNAPVRSIPDGGIYARFWDSVSFLRTFDGGVVPPTVLQFFYNNELCEAYEQNFVRIPEGINMYAFGEAIDGIDRTLLIHWHDASHNADYFDFLRPSDLIAWIAEKWMVSVRN